MFARQNEASTSAFGYSAPTSFGRKPSVLSLLIWYVPALALAAMFGAVAGLGGKMLLIFAFGAVGGLVMLFTPLHMVAAFFLVLSFVVVGPLASIFGIQQASWAPSMISFCLLLRVPMEFYHGSTLNSHTSSGPIQGFSPVMWAVGCYFALILTSAALGGCPPSQLLVGAKLYVFMWGLFFLIVASRCSPKLLERVWKGLLLLALLQFPFALYQRLIEVPKRMIHTSALLALDAVVGSFPGTELGGASGALALFLVFAIALAVSLWRNKCLSSRRTLIVIFASVSTLSLGETKVILVLFPLAFAILFRQDVVRRPLRFLGIGGIMALMAGTAFFFYRDAANTGRSAKQETLIEHVESSFGYVFDPNDINYRRGGVGRFAAIALWYRDGRHTSQTLLLGYGPAASQDSSLNRGVVASRYYPLNINATAAAGMLWDIGVLGLASFLAILLIAYLQALALSGADHIPPIHRSALEASAVLFAMVAVTLPYNGDVLGTAQLQTLLFIGLAQVVYWRHRATDENFACAA
jgi:hypothetical protein